MVRVRFAPSPTGYLHIGSFRTALFNWLFARHNDGVFLVRIEDTDTERSEKKYVDAITDALSWVHIESDEPVLIQSSRMHEHKALIEQLLEQDKAYKDFYTQDEFFKLHEQKYGTAEFAKAFRVCRGQDQNQDKPYVVRFKLPLDESKEICFDDMIRGRICFDMEQLDDFIIARSDGRPMYNFVVVADDIHQKITHVIRGEDHIPNTPKQVLLYRALGHTVPQFAHLPLILGKSGGRLSKRDAATSVMDYYEQGYLADALVNYLVRLGWAHGDQELFSRSELIKLFDLSDVSKHGAMFDNEKLSWLNEVYLRDMDNEQLLEHIVALVPDLGKKTGFTSEKLLEGIALYKERATTLIDLADALKAVAHAPELYDADAYKQWIKLDTVQHLEYIAQMLDTVEPYTISSIKEAVKTYIKEKKMRLADVAQPVRIALVGSSSSPGVFELLALVGKKESIDRIRQLVAHARDSVL